MSEVSTRVLVTGSARGLGLELVRHFSGKLPEGSIVIATSRKPSPELEAVVNNAKNVVFVALDVSSEASILQSVKTAKDIVGEKGLDILVNNAGAHSSTDGGISNM